jgi:shikimate dehydrogenase
MAAGSQRLFCLIGDPVEHSASPHMFKAAFRKEGEGCAYLAFRVRSEDLGKAIEGLKAIGFAGCNVTIPHKLAVKKHLDRLDRSAEASGSVNVIAYANGELVGHNTDGAGAVAALEMEGVSLNGKRILLLGYGGASKAIAFEIAHGAKPEALIIAGRDASRASSLARELSQYVRSDALQLDDAGFAGADVIINCTPVGMWPKTDASPLLPGALHGCETVMDLVYNPPETKLLRLARAQGCKTIGGIEMLVRQGARAFEIWLGKEAPIDEMRKAVKEALLR